MLFSLKAYFVNVWPIIFLMYNLFEMISFETRMIEKAVKLPSLNFKESLSKL